jgi:hypothetical protein
MKAIYAVLLLISAAVLAFQVVLTRFFALAQGNHLAFMAISLALLGAGASGTYLSLRRPQPAILKFWLTRHTLIFTLTVPLAYLAINYLPFDAYLLTLEPLQLLWLTLYYLILTLPFFFGGLVIGAALVTYPKQAGRLYAVNLLGSGLGPPLALLALTLVGGPGAVFICALPGWLAAVISYEAGVNGHQQKINGGQKFTLYAARFLGYVAISALLLFLAFRPPALFEVRLTPYKSLSQALLYPGSEIIFQQWNAFSRVDVLRSQGIRSAPGLSFAYSGQLPPQLGLLVDGDNLAPISQADSSNFTAYLPLALGFTLRPNADVLILEPGGGLAVMAALQQGARVVTVVHSNHTAAEAIRHHFASFNNHLYDDPGVTLVVDEPRSFLRRTNQQFDLILLPLTDSFRPVTAGAYALNEDYRYTVEALAEALAHLKPNGLALVERWLQLPPSESLRLWGTAIEALHQLDWAPGTEDRPEASAVEANPAEHLLALRSLQTSLIGLTQSPLSADDIKHIRQFVEEYQFDLIWLPGVSPDETNRYSVVPNNPYYHTFAQLLTTPNPVAFFDVYPYAITPPTDDHPFFFHFFKWQQTPEIWQTLGLTWQPFGGSGYLVLVVLLALVIVLSTGLIILPLLWPKRPANEPIIRPAVAVRYARFAFLLYFALLGLGFLFVEIPLLQRFILYLGQPAYAFAVVTAALLIAAGVGSYALSGRLPLPIALAFIVLLTITYPLLLPFWFDLTLSLPLAGRVGLTVLTLFPLGALLGVPFPAGLRLVAQTKPTLTPWVWAVNGCASVISAVLAAMLALTWGFSAVLWGAALAYGLAGVVITHSLRVSGTKRTPPQL